MTHPKHALARLLARHAQRRLQRTHPEWATAMAAEVEHVAEHGSELRWSAGCVGASYALGAAPELLKYAAALALALAAMTLDQWIEDEGAGTLLVLALTTLMLGLVSPRRFLLSGIALGLVVAGMHAFGALTGIWPPYETRHHGLLSGLRWLVLVVPAVLTAAVGSRLGRSVRST